MVRILLFCCFFTLSFSAGCAQDMIKGPVTAQVVKIRDGDSLDVIAHVWPGHDVRVSIRVRGIDAPELKARCSFELKKAKQARQELVNLIGKGPVKLTAIAGGKYFGRVLARVETAQGQDVTTSLLKSGHVRPYKGKKRQSWCAASPS